MEFVENAIPGLFIINAIALGDILEDIKVTYVNSSFADSFRSSKGNFMNNVILPEKCWVDPRQRKEYLSVLITNGAVQGIEVKLTRSDGSHFWVKLFSKILRFHDRAFQIQGTLIDISIQKQLLTSLSRGVLPINRCPIFQEPIIPVFQLCLPATCPQCFAMRGGRESGQGRGCVSGSREYF